MSSKSLVKNSIFNVFYTVANFIFPLIAAMYVARILTEEDIGLVASAQNTASYFVIFAALGLPIYGVREIAKVRDDYCAKSKLFSELILINTVSTGVFIAFYSLLIFLIPAYRENYILYMICGISIIFNFINIDWFYQGEEEYSFIAIRSVVVKILSFVALIFFVRDSNDVLVYALINSLALGVNYIFGVFRLKKKIRLTLKNLSYRKHMLPVLLLAFGLLLTTIYCKLDITMLSFMSTKRNVAFYNFSHRTAQIVVTVCISVTNAFLPRLSYFFLNDKDKFYSLINLGFKILCFIAIPASVGVLVMSRYAVTILYGQSFIQSADSLRVFSLFILITSFGNLMGYQVCICTGNENKQLPIYAIAAAVNLAINFLLIPNIQEVGAAIASVISELVVAVSLSVWMSIKFKIKYDVKFFLTSLVNSVIMGVVIYCLKFVISNEIMYFIVGILVGVLLYFILSLLSRNELIINAIKWLRKRKNKSERL